MSLTARLRPLALVPALALGVGLAGCANYDTLKPYQPGAGVITDAPGVKVRNLMLVADGSKLNLVGTVIPGADDSLDGITGTALKQDGSQGQPLTITSSKVNLPANTPVNLADSNVTASGDVKPGGMTQLTLEFAKAGKVTLTTPVVDAKAIDISTSTPS